MHSFRFNLNIKRVVLCSIFYSLLSCHFLFSQNTERSTTTPNILFIIADDLGLDALHSSDYGISLSSQPTTPNIDALKADGVSFINTWAAPQCTPTRAAIMSGKYGIKTGVMTPPGNLDTSHESIFEYLNNNLTTNYAKAVIGKWHISHPTNANHPYEHGADYYEGVIEGTIDDYYSWDKVDENGQTVEINEYVTKHFTDTAINWISNQTDPWFFMVGTYCPS